MSRSSLERLSGTNLDAGLARRSATAIWRQRTRALSSDSAARARAPKYRRPFAARRQPATVLAGRRALRRLYEVLGIYNALGCVPGLAERARWSARFSPYCYYVKAQEANAEATRSRASSQLRGRSSSSTLAVQRRVPDHGQARVPYIIGGWVGAIALGLVIVLFEPVALGVPLREPSRPRASSHDRGRRRVRRARRRALGARKGARRRAARCSRTRTRPIPAGWRDRQPDESPATTGGSTAAPSASRSRSRSFG